MFDRRRFLNLERARPRRQPSEPPAEPSRLARIEAGPSTGGTGTGLSRERFEEPIALASVEPDAPLFHRCHVCGADNQRAAERCTHCTADLRTAAQEAFDYKLFEKERDEQRRERERERDELLHPEPGDAARQAELGKAFGDLIAAEREAARPLAWRLWRRLPERWRWPTVALLAFAGLCLFWLPSRSAFWFWMQAAAGVVCLVLFAPPELWTADLRNRWF